MPQQDPDPSWPEDAVQVPRVPGRCLVPPATGEPLAYSGNWAHIRLQVLKRDAYQCQLRYADICVGRASQVFTSYRPRPAAAVTSPTCEQCACGAMPDARADRERWPNSAELPSGGIPGDVPRLRLGSPRVAEIRAVAARAMSGRAAGNDAPIAARPGAMIAYEGVTRTETLEIPQVIQP
jgi:hypothetical protein